MRQPAKRATKRRRRPAAGLPCPFVLSRFAMLVMTACVLVPVQTAQGQSAPTDPPRSRPDASQVSLQKDESPVTKGHEGEKPSQGLDENRSRSFIRVLPCPIDPTHPKASLRAIEAIVIRLSEHQATICSPDKIKRFLTRIKNTSKLPGLRARAKTLLFLLARYGNRSDHAKNLLRPFPKNKTPRPRKQGSVVLSLTALGSIETVFSHEQFRFFPLPLGGLSFAFRWRRWAGLFTWGGMVRPGRYFYFRSSVSFRYYSVLGNKFRLSHRLALSSTFAHEGCDDCDPFTLPGLQTAPAELWFRVAPALWVLMDPFVLDIESILVLGAARVGLRWEF